jgi:hypothetical protein
MAMLSPFLIIAAASAAVIRLYDMVIHLKRGGSERNRLNKNFFTKD